MRPELFWAYQDTFEALGIPGFGFFSRPHLLWLAGLLAGIIVFSAVYCRVGERARDDMRKGLALFLILFEIFKQCVVALTGAPGSLNLPIEICSFAEYTILADAFWPKNRILKPFLAFAYLPAAFLALLLPATVNYPATSFYAVHLFVLHAAIVAYIAARYAAGELRPRYAGLWLTVLGILLLILPVRRLDRGLGVNYMFLVYHEDNPVLKLVWDLSGGTGGVSYVFGLSVLVILVFHVMYGIFVLLRLVSDRKNRRSRMPGVL